MQKEPKLDEKTKKLQNLLRTLFQLDAADLDFGIYRIMNKKHDEIEHFIDNDLINYVDAEFSKQSESKKEELKKEIKEIEDEISNKVGNDVLDHNGNLKGVYASIPIAKELASKYKKKKSELESYTVSDQLKSDVFSHIYQFFSRYYDNGDFIPLKRYSKTEKYAIPYNGEETYLHWANKGQYFIKTGEYFKNYTFKNGKYKINFQLLNVEETINSNKSDCNRYFVLSSLDENPKYDSQNNILTIFFEYRCLNDDEEKKYGTNNKKEKIKEKIRFDCKENIMNKTNIFNDDEEIIEKHLKVYTEKNTTDYFIHKDLKGFLTRELDFYIKNEIFHLDEFGTEDQISIENYITKANVIKSLCIKIIDFLAQIENFQKMLFEKKKFVTNTEYCMTLDNVPEELYSEILNNKDQIDEWKNLFKLEQIEKGTLNLNQNNTLNFDISYLKNNPYLVLDTKFFSQDFNNRLLASFDNLDDKIEGLMFKSENWQALNLLYSKYNNSIKCCYIDPPYNTGKDDFPFKDNYQHSSWLSMMNDRLYLIREMIKDDGGIFVSIDDNEDARLRLLLGDVFGVDNYRNTIITSRVKKSINETDKVNSLNWGHGYLCFFAKSTDALIVPPVNPVEKSKQKKEKWHAFDAPGIRPTMEYEIFGKKPPEGRHWMYSKEKAEIMMNKGELRLSPSGTVQYKVPESNGVILDTNWTDLVESSSGWGLATEKNTKLMERILKMIPDANCQIIDTFAGSGTTGHAVITSNKNDGGKRKYIMIEMGNYFETLMKPRIQKIMFSKGWNNKVPISDEGNSHIFKYHYLEQYEDTLNNIDFQTSKSVQRTLYEMDGYFLRYMLNYETRYSSCRLNVDKLDKPFSYTLKITEGNELKEKTVDLVETFNYLLGLHVKQIKTFTDTNGVDYKVIFGYTDENSVLVIWRDTDNLDLARDKEFIENHIVSEFKPSITYVNSNFYVESAKPIEPDFKTLMGA